MVESLPRKRVIGKCVYCGSTDQLSDEHAIPSGLRGEIVLQFGTCEECRKAIHPLEDHVLSVMLGPIRLARNTNRKSSDKVRLNIYVVTDYVSGLAPYTARVPTSDLPASSWVMHKYTGIPRILSSHNGEEANNATIVAFIARSDAALQLRKYGGLFRMTFHTSYFPRVIAKIAHCTLTSFLGLEGWRPLLTEYIRFDAEEFYCTELIGEPITGGEVIARNDAEFCPVRAEIRLVTVPNGPTYWVVNLNLLPGSGAPQHGIVVGERLAN